MLHSSSLVRPLSAACFCAVSVLAFAVGCGGDDDDTQTSSSGSSGSSGNGASSGGTNSSSSSSSGNGASGGSDSGLNDAANTPALGPAAVPLGGARQFTVLAESAISNVPTSAVTGDMGISPMSASSITEFSMTKVGTYWTSSQVTGKVYAADNDPPTPDLLTVAINDMHTAYVDAAGRTADAASTNLGEGTIGSRTFAPGLYRWGTSVSIPSDITLAGDQNDTWIFQVTGDLEMASAARMVLSGGALPSNVVWQVAGIVKLGTGAHAEGTMLCKTNIKFLSGASVHGRLFAQTAVTLSSSTVLDPEQ